MKKAAIFDMDGLLFDTERLYRDSWVIVAKRFGQEPDPAFPRAICGTSGAHSLEVIRTHYPAVDAQAFWDCGVARVDELTARSVPVKPGAVEILAFFRERGMKLAVASSSPYEMILRNLEKSGLKGYFAVVLSGEQVERGKPEPDIFLKAAALLGCAPTDCYVFEDGINGSRAGVAAGCATVMVPDPTPPTDDLKQGCTAICVSLLEARDRMENGLL